MQLNMTKRGVLSRLFINSFRADREKAALGMSARVPDLNLARSQGKSPYRAVYQTKRGQTSRFAGPGEESPVFILCSGSTDCQRRHKNRGPRENMAQLDRRITGSMNRFDRQPVALRPVRAIWGNVLWLTTPKGIRLQTSFLRSFFPKNDVEQLPVQSL